MSTRRHKAYFTLFMLFTIGFAGLIWSSVLFFSSPVSTHSEPILLMVKKGMPVRSMIDELEAKQINLKTRCFFQFAIWFGYFKHIKAGEYKVQPGISPYDLFRQLSEGKVLLRKITFPEGWTFAQFLERLKQNSHIEQTLSETDPATIMRMLGDTHHSPEGLFFPDTYLFAASTKDIEILKLAYNLMKKKLNDAWQNRAPNLPYQTPYDALIVASLIEKETHINDERADVASVILRRLNLGMRLQIDAAVLYGLNDQSRRALSRTDLRTDTRYNTYTRSGLPPTPIAMPGLASINAALHPSDKVLLYYVATGSGRHKFSKTWLGHQKAVLQYRKWQKQSRQAKHAEKRPAHQPLDTWQRSNWLTPCLGTSLMRDYWRSAAP